MYPEGICHAIQQTPASTTTLCSILGVPVWSRGCLSPWCWARPVWSGCGCVCCRAGGEAQCPPSRRTCLHHEEPSGSTVRLLHMEERKKNTDFISRPFILRARGDTEAFYQERRHLTYRLDLHHLITWNCYRLHAYFGVHHEAAEARI